MSGTTISLSDEWVESYAERVGVSEGSVVRAITEFQRDVESYTGMAKEKGVSIICNEEGFPRLDDYLPKVEVETVTRLTPDERQKMKEKREAEAIAKRERSRDVHRRLREKLGMPPADR